MAKVQFRIQRTDPEKDVRRLARRLGDAIEGERVAKENSDHYFAEANRVRKRIVEYQEILEKVIARDAGAKIEYVGRMDPMRTYDAGALAAQIQAMRGQVAQFEEIARQAQAEVIAQRALVAETSRAISRTRE